MSLQPLVPALMLLLALTTGVMTWAAAARMPSASIAAAASFLVAVLAAAWWINRPILVRGHAGADGDRDLLIHAGRRNARLMALTYAWGALALLAVYKLAGLRWQHGWQYGAAMAVMAGGLLVYVHKLGDPQTLLRRLGPLDAMALGALIQGLAIIVGLGALLASGKLWSGRNDWAANHVFVAGGLAIAGISILAFLVHRRLRPRHRS